MYLSYVSKLCIYVSTYQRMKLPTFFFIYLYNNIYPSQSVSLYNVYIYMIIYDYLYLTIYVYIISISIYQYI